MFTLTSTPAVVKPASFLPFMAPVVKLDPAAHRAALETSYAAADFDDSWHMSDREADELAFDSECQDRYESGAFAW